MNVKIDLVEATASDIVAKLEEVEQTPGLRDALGREAGDRSALAAVLCVGERKILLGYWVREPYRAWPDIAPYDQWLSSEENIHFWRIAFGWDLYWNTIGLGPFWGRYSERRTHWRQPLDRPIETDPLIVFLDLSCGYVHWDFQLRLLCRLCGLDDGVSDAIRKRINRCDAGVRDTTKTLMLPDGRSLFAILNTRERVGFPQFLHQPPVHAASSLFKAAMGLRVAARA